MIIFIIFVSTKIFILMKHALTLLFLLMVGFLYPNVSTGYTFTQPASTYTAINGGTVLGSTTCDDELFLTNTTGSATSQTAAGFSIGFTFKYNGSNYTQFGVSNNGYIKLGNLPTFTMSSNGFYQSIAATGDNRLIAACNNDLQGQTGSVLQYLTQGSAPNRTLTIQWSGFRLFGATNDVVNFQIILYETTNVIEFSYGTFTYGTGQSSWVTTAMAGLYGNSNSDYFLRTHTTNWSTTNNGGSNSANISYNGTCLPANNLMFRYTPNIDLPIKLVYFKGFQKIGGNELSWKVASQINNERFVIEKSNDGLIWNELSIIKGAGTTSMEYIYNTTDETPYDITYYKLTQFDFDGHSETFKVIVITSTKENTISTSPNPFKDVLNVKFNDSERYEIKVIDITGKVVFNRISENEMFSDINTSTFAEGYYSVLITSEKSFYSKLFIKH